MRLRTAVGEATMNAVEHGNQGLPELPVDFVVERVGSSVVVSITDQGTLAGELRAEPADLESRLSGERSPRGWGLLLIENMVDDVQVIPGEGQTTVRLEVIAQAVDDE